jgi:vancomycin resistance protein YoaR
MRLARGLASLASVGLLGIATWLCTNLWSRAFTVPVDALLDQWALPAPSDLPAFVRWVARVHGAKNVYLDTGTEPLSVTLAQLGVVVNVEQTLDLVRQLPQRQTAWERVWRVLTGPPARLRVIDPAFAFDSNVARRTFERIAPQVNRDAIDARLDYAHHRRIEDEPGRELDVAATLEANDFMNTDDGDVITLRFRSIPARVSALELPAVNVARVLSDYATSFAHRAGARAVNIRRGAQLLDGFVLAPHATFSFNSVVIINDEIDKGVGGGICQVASTLHAAAVYAGLPVLERRSHSRPSGYAPLGLDATVIDGKVDLRFSNPYDESLLIHAFLPTATSIRVEILGREPEWKVEHAAQVVKRHSFLRRVVEKTELAPGEFKRSQKGTYGYDIISVVRYTDPSGSVTTHQYKSNYYPVPEVFWVSPGTRPESLPPLPEGADGLEERDMGAAVP